MPVAGYNDQRGMDKNVGIEQMEDLACLYINKAGEESAVITLNIQELHVFILRCQAVENDLVAHLQLRQNRVMHLGSTRIHDEQEREIMVYRGTLTDGRVICVDQNVFEMSQGDYEPEIHGNPDEWLESLDGECVFIEGHFMEAK